jgi:signal transduction histidine kinase
LRRLSLVISCSAILVLLTITLACATRATSVPTAQFGTETEARALLDKAIAELKLGKDQALEKFNKSDGGFRDRDLYVFCANASDGVMTAHPVLRGEHLQDIVGKKGYPLGQEIMQKATEGEIKQVTYWWPRPGTEEPREKNTFYTRVGDQNCGVGYYK